MCLSLCVCFENVFVSLSLLSECVCFFVFCLTNVFVFVQLICCFSVYISVILLLLLFLMCCFFISCLVNVFVILRLFYECV